MRSRRIRRRRIAGFKNWWDWYRKPVMWILVIFWMGLIFSFSAQNADTSSKVSGGITKQVVKLLVNDFDIRTEVQQEEIMNTASFIVRKTAHFTEYFILGILIWNLFRCYEFYGAAACFFSWLAGTVYAGTDELHQFFSDGRSPQIRDVCIDSAGVLAGILLVLGLKKLATGGKKERIRWR